MIRFIITLPFILVLFYITFKFIWGEIQYRRSMRHIQKFNDFHKMRLIPWVSTISEQKIREQYVKYCLDLLHEKTKTNNFIFDEDKEITKIRHRFGKYIPELQQESREEQIEKILS